MASILFPTVCVMMTYMACICGNPIKRSATDGTECSTTDTKVNFPENVTDVVLNFIPDMMEKHDQKLGDMAHVMNVVVELLQNQLFILNERLPILQAACPPEAKAPSLTQGIVPQAGSPSLTQGTVTQAAFPPEAKAPSLTQGTIPQASTQSSTTEAKPHFEDCQDVAAAGLSYQSGVYTIAPHGGLDPFQVYCDLDTEGASWTVFQRRFDGSVDFFLEWDDYVRGFGSADGEYWAGLHHIHQLTQSGTWQLRIDMEAFDGDTAYAKYDSFSVGNASAKYQLHIDAYHGTAGDSLTWHNDMYFSTKDRDNDALDSTHCAQLFKGAWWYNGCQQTNLNALYLGQYGNDNTGNRWGKFKAFKSLKRTEMKMRQWQQPALKDCQDGNIATAGLSSGVYSITPGGDVDPLYVYCDLDTEGGGWTVFQRRFDGSVDFHLEWDDYVRGFGSADGEYWAGLSLIHRMTQTGTWQLRIDMEAFDGDTAYAMYDSFSIGNASSKYQLHIGAYHGTAGDSLAYHNGMYFSTKDRDNDNWNSSPCAAVCRGAWWFDHCHHAHLNGQYLGPTGGGDTANSWKDWKGHQSLQRTEMKMRRVN